MEKHRMETRRTKAVPSMQRKEGEKKVRILFRAFTVQEFIQNENGRAG